MVCRGGGASWMAIGLVPSGGGAKGDPAHKLANDSQWAELCASGGWGLKTEGGVEVGWIMIGQ